MVSRNTNGVRRSQSGMCKLHLVGSRIKCSNCARLEREWDGHSALIRTPRVEYQQEVIQQPSNIGTSYVSTPLLRKRGLIIGSIGPTSS
eukprot:706393-Amphidinium_carterae.1